MALSTAAELKTSVQDWLDRSDYSAVADDMIVLAEGHFNLELRSRQMVTATDLTPTAGVCTLPTDFLGPVKVVAKTSPRCQLGFVDISGADSAYDSSVVGRSESYTIRGSSLITYPQSTYDIELTYWQEIPPLADNSSNWLLAKYPNIYLETCMMEAHRYFRNTDELSISAQRVENMIRRLHDTSDLEQYANAAKLISGSTP